MSRTSAHYHGHYFNEQDEQISHELRSTRTARIDLDAFLALSGEDRAARWRQWERPTKDDAVSQMLTRHGIERDDEAVAMWIAKYDERWGTQPQSDLPIPPVSEILEVVADTIGDARRHEDWQGVRQFDRIRANLLGGAKLAWHRGDLLISSLNTPGAVYSVNGCGCSCPNGAAGKTSCWHVALFDTLLDMRATAIETADMLAEQAEATEQALRDRLVAARAKYLEAA